MASTGVWVAGFVHTASDPTKENADVFAAISSTSLPVHSLACLVMFLALPQNVGHHYVATSRADAALLRLHSPIPAPAPFLLQPTKIRFPAPPALPTNLTSRPVRLHLLHGPGGSAAAAVQPEGRRWVGAGAGVCVKGEETV